MRPEMPPKEADCPDN